MQGGDTRRCVITPRARPGFPGWRAGVRLPLPRRGMETGDRGGAGPRGVSAAVTHAVAVSDGGRIVGRPRDDRRRPRAPGRRTPADSEVTPILASARRAGDPWPAAQTLTPGVSQTWIEASQARLALAGTGRAFTLRLQPEGPRSATVGLATTLAGGSRWEVTGQPLGGDGEATSVSAAPGGDALALLPAEGGSGGPSGPSITTPPPAPCSSRAAAGSRRPAAPCAGRCGCATPGGCARRGRGCACRSAAAPGRCRPARRACGARARWSPGASAASRRGGRPSCARPSPPRGRAGGRSARCGRVAVARSGVHSVVRP
jgi:hypothetical protein